MKVVIAGAGGIGSVIASHMHRGGHDIALLDEWQEHIDAINRAGLSLEEPAGVSKVSVPAVHLSNLGQLPWVPELICLAVKSYDTEHWASRLRNLVTESHVPVLSIQNGYNEEVLVTVLGSENVLGGVATIDGNLAGPGMARRFGKVGGFVVGELDGRLTNRIGQAAEAFQSVAPSRVSDNITGELWSKLVRSSGMGPVCVITNEGQSRVVKDPKALAVVVNMIADSVRCATRLNVQLVPAVLWGIEADVFSTPSGPGRLDEVAAKLRDEYGGLDTLIPSVLRDVRNGRPTEIDYMFGWIARKAKEAGQPVPVLDRALEMIRLIETGQLRGQLANAHVIADEFRLLDSVSVS